MIADGKPRERPGRMQKRTRRIIKWLALAAGALGATGTVYMTFGRRREANVAQRSVWARPHMQVVFRAEIMPGREATERTFRVRDLLPNDRVTLYGIAGEHSEKEFEPLRH